MCERKLRFAVTGFKTEVEVEENQELETWAVRWRLAHRGETDKVKGVVASQAAEKETTVQVPPGQR